MKSLSLPRPLILMIIGIPGAGKSFFARQFAHTFHVPLVSTDFLRRCVSPEPSYNQAEDDVVDSIADQEIRELMKTQKTFLVDGGLNVRADRFGLEKLAREHDYSTLTIWVQTDEPTCHARATRRNLRRSGDALNPSISDAQFTSLSKRLTAPSAQEQFVVISGKHTYATQAKVVLKKLVMPRHEKQVHNSGAYSTQTYDQSKPATPTRRNIAIN